MKNNTSKVNFFTIIGLSIIVVCIYWLWFLKLSDNTYGDWMYFATETQRLFFSLPNIWLTYNFGTIDIGLSSHFSVFIVGILSKINNFALTERLVYFWPSVILATIGSYILGRKKFSSKAAFIGSLIYTLNTYSLTLRTGHLTLAVAFAFAPLIIYFFIRTLEEKKIWLALITGLLATITSAYEFRAFYIIAFVLFAYYVYYSFLIDKISLKNLLKNSIYALIPMLIVFLLNLYWILGLLNVGNLLSNELFSRGLFGDQFLNIKRAITLFHPFWNGSEPVAFQVNKIPFYFWFIPVIAFSGLILNHKNKNVIFFGIIALIGILLTKQSGQPFPQLYRWLYNNFPGFNAFREASKFFFLIALGYSVLFAAFVDWIWKHKNKYKIGTKGASLITISIAALILWNTKPVITGEIGSLYVPRTIPNDYIAFKDFLLSQEDFSRTLWIPIDSRWSIYTNEHPKVPATTETPVVFKILRTPYSDLTKFNQDMTIVKSYLDQGSIKYVIVPIEDDANDDNFFVYYEDRDFYISQLDKVPFLKKLDLGTKELTVYENSSYLPHIYLTSNQTKIEDLTSYRLVEHSYISPTQYEIRIENITTPSYLNFAETYHPDWSLRPGNFTWYDALTHSNYFIDEQIHTKTETGFNSFLIDPEKICNEFDCEYNEDGSYNINLTLYFKSQSYVYLGGIISLATLFVVLSVLLRLLIKNLLTKQNPQ